MEQWQPRVKELLKLVLQLFHLILAASILLTGIAEFSVEPTIFDVFGKQEHRALIPKEVVSNVYGINNATISNKALGHILDAPIFVLFLIYFLSVVWLKCRGVFAWLLTCSQVVTVLLFLVVNAGLSRALDWRYFSTRAVTIILDVLILSFSWSTIIVTLLHIRGWFPFKIKKYRDIPYGDRTIVQKIMVIVWNFIALYLVLGLCFLIWFSKLYMSWACVRFSSEILVLCQFTNMVQCWPCSAPDSHCDVANITNCVEDYDKFEPDGPVRCISPLYTVHAFSSAFCVFNYNIGLFTIVTVFSYVGGIYFFMRTVLNALVKCLFSIGFIAVHFCCNIVFKISNRHEVIKDPEHASVNDVPDSGENDEHTPVTADPRVSLLGPLPHYFGYKSTDSKANPSKTKYI